MDPLFELGLLIKALQRELERQANETMEPLGLTAAQADALAVIGQAGSLSLRELGELVIAEGGHPSRLVDRLVDAGLVERATAGEDRRRVELSLTADGRRMQRRVLRAREQMLQLGHQVIGERDLGPAIRTLGELLGLTSFAGLVERRRELLKQAG